MNKADKIFRENCHEILKNGLTTKGQKVRPKYSDGVDAHTVFITQICETYDIGEGEFPITTLRPINWKNGVKEILWIYQDQTSDLDILKNKYGIHWWDEWAVEGNSIGQRYGATVKKYDLMNKLLKGLTEEPYGRRHIIDLYQYSDFEMTKGLLPCAKETLWSVRGDFIDVTLIQRSSDYLVAGHINKMQYVALMMMVARHCNLKLGKFTHFTQNLHIYDRHMTQLKEMLNRKESKKQPKLILDTNKTNFYSFKIEDFKLINYEPVKPQLKFELGI